MKTVLTVKISSELKKQAQALAEEVGLPLSTVVAGSLKESIEKKEVRFSAPYQMSAKLERKLAKVEKDIKAGKNMSPAFSDPEEAIRYLRSR
ncbi:MAG: hypothetical protein A2846_01015 [Candidatus Doudnabacteria bacterium RIFCSPHIGHO2_01_FULL_49_9]|uniref:Uncharacterized protein n=1 Tax=Candidatus Doudnabacteria bacterium RIFCSPHIGHO2_01_FULL_49_9 TaxID=1817827 RepID=A0A1F5P4F0_9BACT|nr:MAG: hypothetical protein A2846_01015 [Candidatus Doudnabacteria bacterium RIFCSPHIGHO2_01_FULL_49_9]